MTELKDIISQIDRQDIGMVLQNVLQRYNELFPEWEITTISIERGRDRKEQIDNMIRLLENIKITL